MTENQTEKSMAEDSSLSGIINLDRIIESSITDRLREEDSFMTRLEKTVMNRLLDYTVKVIQDQTRCDSPVTEDKADIFLEKYAGDLLDAVYASDNVCLKKGMQFGANLMLQLLDM